jgi:hypothetical protein
MNCKPGDLAVIVYGPSSGKVVRCLRIIGRFRTVYPGRSEWTDWWWAIDRPLPAVDGSEVSCECNDSILRPIRDQDGDESFIRKVSVDDQINVLRKINQRKVKA